MKKFKVNYLVTANNDKRYQYLLTYHYWIKEVGQRKIKSKFSYVDMCLLQ